MRGGDQEGRSEGRTSNLGIPHPHSLSQREREASRGARFCARLVLPKVARMGDQFAQQERIIREPLRDDVQHLAFALHFAFHGEQARL